MPTIPAASGTYVLSIIGGIGGSITMLSYNYWMREEKISDARYLGYVRGDIAIAYLFTALFGISIMFIANQAFYVSNVRISDAQAVPKMAEMLGAILGPFGAYAYSVGFWAAVFASLLGVWQSVPYIYADFYSILKKDPEHVRQRGDQGHQHSLPAGAALHHARADAVRVHPAAALHHRDLHDRRQPVHSVPGRHAAVPEQPRRWTAPVPHNRWTTNALLFLILRCSWEWAAQDDHQRAVETRRSRLRQTTVATGLLRRRRSRVLPEAVNCRVERG